MDTGDKHTRLAALSAGVLLLALGGYASWLRSSSSGRTTAESPDERPIVGLSSGLRSEANALGGLSDRARTQYGGMHSRQRTRAEKEKAPGSSMATSEKLGKTEESPLDLDFNLSQNAQDRYALSDEEFEQLRAVIARFKRTVAEEERRVMWDENQHSTSGVTLHIPAWNMDYLAMERDFLTDLGAILGESGAQSFLKASGDAIMLSSGYFGANPRRYDIRLISSRSGSTSYVARVTAGANITDAGTLENPAEALGSDGVMQTRHFANLPDHWSHLFQAPAELVVDQP